MCHHGSQTYTHQWYGSIRYCKLISLKDFRYDQHGSSELVSCNVCSWLESWRSQTRTTRATYLIEDTPGASLLTDALLELEPTKQVGVSYICLSCIFSWQSCIKHAHSLFIFPSAFLSYQHPCLGWLSFARPRTRKRALSLSSKINGWLGANMDHRPEVLFREKWWTDIHGHCGTTWTWRSAHFFETAMHYPAMLIAINHLRLPPPIRLQP